MIVTLRWMLYFLTFTPLLFNTHTLSQYVFTKTLIIRVVVTLFWVGFAGFVLFRKERARVLLERLLGRVYSPIYIWVSLFLVSFALSTLFAVNPYRAFWGDIERGEGFVGLLYFMSLLLAFLTVFEKKEWLNFLKLSLGVGGILFLDSLTEVLGGELVRAESFVGNPAFLAVYFLFIVFAGLVLFVSEEQSRLWRIIGFTGSLLGVAGVFLTGTRGAILGLVVGTVTALLYVFAVGGNRSVEFPIAGRVSLRKTAVGALAFILLCIGLFYMTSEANFWRGVPGVSRFASVSAEDETLQTRLISIGVGLDSINPTEDGLGKFMWGYGPENFNIAYNAHYNPEYLRYENAWFDRAHNKLIDVLVMQGLFGLLVYLSLWGSVLYVVFKRMSDKRYAAPILFLGVAYFVQNLFLFDQVVTNLVFFSFLAFVICFSDIKEPKPGSLMSKLLGWGRTILPYKASVLAIILVYLLIFSALIPYRQARAFVSGVESRDAGVLSEQVEKFSEPYTFAQAEIRNELTKLVTSFVGVEEAEGIVDRAVELQEEYFDREPYDPRDSSLLANIYRLRGELERAEEYERISLELAPARQDHLFSIGSLAFDRGNVELGNEYAEELLLGSPDVPQTNFLYGALILRGGPEYYEEALQAFNRAIFDEDMYFNTKREAEIMRSDYRELMEYFEETRDYKNSSLVEDGLDRLDVFIEELGEEI